MSEHTNINISGADALKKSWGNAIYFLGIGGIGMSALARYFKSIGLRVSGYDKTPTPLTKQLQQEGIHIHFEDDIEQADKEASLVVYTPAIPKDHAELNYFKNNHYNLLKRSDVLGMITQGQFSICVAGTHGKTTTSAMIAHVLRDSGYGCNAFLGGIASNYDTNFWSSGRAVCVAEADEYDRSFLKLSPNVAIITAMDADHLDIYGTEKNMQDAFIEFSKKLDKDGLLVLKNDIERIAEFEAGNGVLYSLQDNTADAFVSNVEMNNGSYKFDVHIKNYVLKGVELNMGGMHNIENSVAAIVVAKHLGLSDEAIKQAVASFKGVKRRFEYVYKSNEKILIDDYAHHPEELRALITGAKDLFPGKKCTVIFQPHLYSRTRDLADGFAEVLSMADETILLPIYPARELPIEGVSSEMILDKMTLKNKKVLSKVELIEWLRQNNTELLIAAGAGDIDAMLGDIKNIVAA